MDFASSSDGDGGGGGGAGGWDDDSAPSGAATTLPRLGEGRYVYEERFLDDGRSDGADSSAGGGGGAGGGRYSSSSSGDGDGEGHDGDGEVGGGFRGGVGDFGYPPDFILVEAHPPPPPPPPPAGAAGAPDAVLEEDGGGGGGESKGAAPRTKPLPAAGNTGTLRPLSKSKKASEVKTDGGSGGGGSKKKKKTAAAAAAADGKKKKKNKKKKSTKKRGRSKSKGRRRGKRGKSKDAKRKKKKNTNTSSAEWQFENQAYTAAQRWAAYDDAAIHSDVEEPLKHLLLDFKAGPIGVTFAWQNGLVVMAVPGLMASSKGELSPSFPPLGARLSMIDKESVVGMNFSATVGKLEEAQGCARSLGFHILPEGSGSATLASAPRRGGGGGGGEEEEGQGVNTGADILKLPSISRPSSSSTARRGDFLGGGSGGGSSSGNNDGAARPSSAGMSVDNPEKHERELAQTSEIRKKGAWKETKAADALAANATATKLTTSTTSSNNKKATKKPAKKQAKKKPKNHAKKKSKKGKGKDEEEEEEFVGDPYVGPVQQKIEARLQQDFDAVHVKVINRTYFYRNRAFLGQKRFNLREATQNKTSLQWEARIWTLEFDNATGKAKATKTWLGQTSRKASALKMCERAAEKRDRGEFEPIPIEPGKPDETDFDVLVVSRAFEHRAVYDRLEDVYEVILDETYETVDPFETDVAAPAVRTLTTIEQEQQAAEIRAQKKKEEEDDEEEAKAAGLAKKEERLIAKAHKGKKKGKKGKQGKGGRGRSRSPSNRARARSRSRSRDGENEKTNYMSPAQKRALAARRQLAEEEKLHRVSRRVGFGTIGVNVTNSLPEFRFYHPHRPRRFSIVAKTPSQWDPSRFDPALSERFGGAHLDPTSLGLDEHTKAGNKDMKMLERPPPPDLTEDATDEERMHQKGGPPLFPDVRGKRKAGTRIGHFFFGLSKKTKEMMDTHRKDLAKHAARAALAEADEAHRQEELKRRAAAKKSGGVSGFAAIVAANSGPKKAASEMFRDTVRKQAHAARLLQRVYRRNRVPRMIRKRIRRHRAATNIGRNYRGYKGRLYFRELFRIKTIAAISIEATYRMMVGARIAAEFRRVRTAAALRIQPVVRGWFGRQFVAWKRANDKIGTTMNKVVRGYLARCKFKRMLAAHFHRTVVVPAVVVIQCMLRSAVARILLKKLKHEKWIREVAIPAAILIQKRVRGMIVRERFRIAALRQRSALLIQRIVRGWSCRLEFPRIKLRALKLKKIVIMQCFARKVRENCFCFCQRRCVSPPLTLISSFVIRHPAPPLPTSTPAVRAHRHAKAARTALPLARAYSCHYQSAGTFSYAPRAQARPRV